MDVFKTLGVSYDVSMEDLKLRWRNLASKLHPDHGGDANEFNKAHKAYKTALAYVKNREATCKTCFGWKTINQGGLVLPCPVCTIKKG